MKDESILHNMVPKLRFTHMSKDDDVWEKLDEVSEEWEESLRTEKMIRAIGGLILKYREGEAELMHSVIKGGYNLVYRLEYKDGSSVIMKIPIKGISCIP